MTTITTKELHIQQMLSHQIKNMYLPEWGLEYASQIQMEVPFLLNDLIRAFGANKILSIDKKCQIYYFPNTFFLKIYFESSFWQLICKSKHFVNFL